MSDTPTLEQLKEIYTKEYRECTMIGFRDEHGNALQAVARYAVENHRVWKRLVKVSQLLLKSHWNSTVGDYSDKVFKPGFVALNAVLAGIKKEERHRGTIDGIPVTASAEAWDILMKPEAVTTVESTDIMPELLAWANSAEGLLAYKKFCEKVKADEDHERHLGGEECNLGKSELKK